MSDELKTLVSVPRSLEVDVEPWSHETQELRRRRGAGDFAPTPQALVKRASLGDAEATTSLFRLYWRPIQGFLRRKGAREDEANDVTQRFLLGVMRRKDFAKVQLERRSFRGWLKTGAKRQLLNLRAEQRAQRRVEQAAEEAEVNESLSRGAPPDAEQLLRQRRALDFMARVWQRLAAQYEAAGDRRLFEHLRATVSELGSPVSDAELCRELGRSKDYVAVCRMRLRTKEFPAALAAEAGASASLRAFVQSLLRDLE